MRCRRGWECACCNAVVLEYRKKRPEVCPACRSGAGYGSEPRNVVNLEATDFPKKPRHHPDQTDLFDGAPDVLEPRVFPGLGAGVLASTPAFDVED